MCGLLFLNTSICTLFNVPVNTKVPFRSYPEQSASPNRRREPEEVVHSNRIRRFRTSGGDKSPEAQYSSLSINAYITVYTDKSNIHFNGMRLLDAFN